MALRTLRRKVIIREYDYNKVRDQALGGLIFFDGMGLYDRAEFTPLNQETLEKLKVVEILRGKKNTPILEADLDLKIPALLVRQLSDYLYDSRYYNWSVTTDDDGFLCVQARKNTPKSRLGWAVFEKDLESRI
jgi:hypothetical protein